MSRSRRSEIARLEDLRADVIEDRIEADLALGHHADVVGELKSLVAECPLRERLHEQLMVALYRCGRQPEALAAYQVGPPGAWWRNSASSRARRCSVSSARSWQQDAWLDPPPRAGPPGATRPGR